MDTLLMISSLYLCTSIYKGPMVVDSKEGNLLEISKLDGSLHRYLTQIHTQFGRIVAFFMGKQVVVSLSSYDLVQEHVK